VEGGVVELRQPPPRLMIQNDTFVLDGKPLVIKSAEVHYWRVHPSYWADRLERLAAMGVNAVQVYVSWNLHEEVRGEYDFSGPNDLVGFLQMAHDLGLLVLLRPGPYICAETDFGGLPYWLLNPTDGTPPEEVKLRTYDEWYMTAVRSWWAELFSRVQPLLLEEGGPIAMVQIENEYGGYGNVHGVPEDEQYMRELVGIAREHLGEAVVLYTVDFGEYAAMRRGSLPGDIVLTAGDCGPGANYERLYLGQRLMNPKGLSPQFIVEWYTGWLVHYGEEMVETSAVQIKDELDELLSDGTSVSLYMGHGGSNFGWSSGANVGLDKTQPFMYQMDVQSYDYNAPLSESGDHGQSDADKYLSVQAALAKHADGALPAEPPANPKILQEVPVTFTEMALLMDSIDLLRDGAPVTADAPLTMEQLGQAYGLVLYTTPLGGAGEGQQLIMDKARDRVTVMVDDKAQWPTLDRGNGLPHTLRLASSGARLQLLVENEGRTNFGRDLVDPKGLLRTPRLLGRAGLDGAWTMHRLPLRYQEVAALGYEPLPAGALARAPLLQQRLRLGRPVGGEQEQGAQQQQLPSPAFFRAELPPLAGRGDAWLDTSCWGRGVAWVNGFHLGRYWAVGPQQALYVPAAVLSFSAPGDGDVGMVNEVVVLEMDGVVPAAGPAMRLVNAPMFNSTEVLCGAGL